MVNIVEPINPKFILFLPGSKQNSNMIDIIIEKKAERLKTKHGF